MLSVAARRASGVLVFGGGGCLGQAVVKRFAASSWRTISVDFVENQAADASHVLEPAECWQTSALRRLSATLQESVGEGGVYAVVNVAGGWIGDSFKDENVLAAASKMIDMNVNSALAASHLAAKLLRPTGGMLVLTGAFPALMGADGSGGTPGMVSYGACKAAIHHMCKSAALEFADMDASVADADRFGSDEEAVHHLRRKAVCVLPQTIDTPSNRSAMPDADLSDWTPPDALADIFVSWAEAGEAEEDAGFESGGLYSVLTKGGETSVELVG